MSKNISRSLSLAHLTVLEATPPELVTLAAEAGFDCVGLRIYANPSVGATPYNMLRDTSMMKETLSRLSDTGTSVLDIEFLRFEPDVFPRIPDQFLETGAMLKAKYILVMSALSLENETLDNFSKLCERAKSFNLNVCLENAVYTSVKTLTDAVCVVRKSGFANASVLVDALHFSRSGGCPTHIKEFDSSMYRYAQICDAKEKIPTRKNELIKEARTGRLWPGEGSLPLRELIAALPSGIPLAIESPVHASRKLPMKDRAQKAYQSLTHLLST